MIRAGIVSFVACITISVALGAEPSTAPTSSPTTAPMLKMLVTVTEVDGKAIPNAEVIVETKAGKKSVRADENGHTTIEFSGAREEYLRVTATAPSHTPAKAMWWMAAKTPDLLPPDGISFALRPGTLIGGTLQNENGDPIANAEVRLRILASDSSEDGYRAGTIRHGPDGLAVKTDAEGAWSYDGAPSEWNKAYITPSHPDYVKSLGMTDKSDAGEALRTGADVTVLSAGRTISGRVVDEQGQPVAHAKVFCDRFFLGGSTSVETDADGKFIINHAPPEDAVLLVVARDGHAPQVVPLEAGDDVGDVQVALSQPQELRGIVVDAKGNPIKGAEVAVIRWDNRTVQPSLLRCETGEDGMFRCLVPTGELQFMIYAEDFAAKPMAELKPQAEPRRIILQRPVKISGHVSDARTGQPIAKFVATLGTEYQDRARWGRHKVKSTDGQYTLESPNEMETYLVRIEAPGYRPVESDVLMIEDDKCAFDAALEPED